MEQETIAAGEITLRPFALDDIPWVHEVSLDPAVARFVQIPRPYERAHAEHFVREMAIAAWARGQRAEFVVVRTGDSTRLGRVGLGLDGDGAWIGSLLGSELPTRPGQPPAFADDAGR